MKVGLFEIKDMKKNILTKTLTAFAAAAVLTGCIEETYPQGSTQRDDQVLGSDLAIAGMMRGIPAAMMNSGTANYMNVYGTHMDFGMPAIHIATESMLEDLAVMGPIPSYYQFYPYSYNLGMGDNEWPVSYFWDCYYVWIKLANAVINMIPSDTDNEQYRAYLGQAYAYRASFYLDLGRMYEPKDADKVDVTNVKELTVPIVDEKTTEEQSQNNPRVKRDVLYNFIFSDLKKAEGYLDGIAFNYASPSLAAVYGLYARAYLEMGYWKDGGDQEAFKNAYDYADKAIAASGCVPLTQAQWEDPATGFNSGSSNQSWIWGLQVSVEQLNNLCSFTSTLSCEALWGYAGRYVFPGAFNNFYSKIRKKDFRRHSWYNPEEAKDYNYKLAGNASTQQVFVKNATQLPLLAIKFRPVLGEMMDFTVGNPADHPMMRVEEMEFIKMEAKAHSDYNGAVKLLNDYMNNYRIVKNGADDDYVYDCTAENKEVMNYVPVSDKATFLDEMLFQKRVEFWGEGILYFDYKRIGKGINRATAGSNHPEVWRFKTIGRSPQWNFVISKVGELSSNTGIPDEQNNPDPSGLLE